MNVSNPVPVRVFSSRAFVNWVNVAEGSIGAEIYLKCFIENRYIFSKLMYIPISRFFFV